MAQLFCRLHRIKSIFSIHSDTYLLIIVYSLLLQLNSATSRRRPSSIAQRERATASRAKKSSSLQRGRYGNNLLYNSSEDEEERGGGGTTEPSGSTVPTSLSRPHPLATPSSHRLSTGAPHVPHDGAASNPFENFTVGSERDVTPTSIRNTEISGRQSKNRLPVSATVSISASGSRFNPLGQVEGCAPALIPEGEDGGGSGYGRSQDHEGDCPVIDNWLVDDLSTTEQHQNRRKRHHGSSSTEIRSFLEGNSSTTSSTSTGSKRKRPLKRTSRTSSQGVQSSRRTGDVEQSALGQSSFDEHSSKKRKTNVVELSSSDSDERFLDSVIVTDDDFMDLGDDGSNSRPCQNLTSSSSMLGEHSAMAGGAQDTRNTLHRSGERPSLSNQSRTGSHREYQRTTPSSTASQNQPSSTRQSNATTSSDYTHRPSYSELPPLRTRVRIESKSYLIPCPRRDERGLDTTIGWLVAQASERHYKQEGARPRLSLTTPDGAILCPSDPIVHVIGENEEVVGVVEEWLEATLEERYLAACKNAQVGESISSTYNHPYIYTSMQPHVYYQCFPLASFPGPLLTFQCYPPKIGPISLYWFNFDVGLGWSQWLFNTGYARKCSLLPMFMCIQYHAHRTTFKGTRLLPNSQSVDIARCLQLESHC